MRRARRFLRWLRHQRTQTTPDSTAAENVIAHASNAILAPPISNNLRGYTPATYSRRQSTSDVQAVDSWRDGVPSNSHHVVTTSSRPGQSTDHIIPISAPPRRVAQPTVAYAERDGTRLNNLSESEGQYNDLETLGAAMNPVYIQSMTSPLSAPAAQNTVEVYTREMTPREKKEGAEGTRPSIEPDLQATKASGSHASTITSAQATNQPQFDPDEVSSQSALVEGLPQPSLVKVLAQSIPVDVLSQPTPAKMLPQPGPVEVWHQVSPVEIPSLLDPAEVLPEPNPVEALSKLDPVEVLPQPSPVEVLPQSDLVELSSQFNPVEALPEPDPVELLPQPDPVEVLSQHELVEVLPQAPETEQTIRATSLIVHVGPIHQPVHQAPRTDYQRPSPRYDPEISSQLLRIAKRGYTERDMEIRLERRADPNVKGPGGNTALHLAAGNNSPELIAVLLGWGAYCNVRNDTGSTPLHISAEMGHQTICEKLMRAGADTWLQDHSGQTPRDLARNSYLGRLYVPRRRAPTDIDDRHFPGGRPAPRRQNEEYVRQQPAADPLDDDRAHYHVVR